MSKKKAREANLIHKTKTIDPLGMNKRDELSGLCNFYLFFRLFSLAATPYHVIPCNFPLLFYNSIYSAYSRFFLINLLKTGIGQAKYCIPQPFSRCLISLCSSLFDFNSIFIFFDSSRSCLIQRWATLIVHGFCSGFSSLSLHYLLLTLEKIVTESWLREGVGGQLPKNLKWSGVCYHVRLVNRFDGRVKP